MLKDQITPNQCLLLLGIRNKISVGGFINTDLELKSLFNNGYLEAQGKYDLMITPKGRALMVKYDNYFAINKKKTTQQLLGKEGTINVKDYREIFPASKLPSGVPARNNVKILTENFRWFFSEYDYSWEEIIKATKMYVNEFRDKQYLYMQNSQYFISKQDKHKVKTSKLADYCDMIREGVTTEDDHFKERVV
jgi:hypothetical protein